MKMNVSVELEGATETSGKLVELKKQIDVGTPSFRSCGTCAMRLCRST